MRKGGEKAEKDGGEKRERRSLRIIRGVGDRWHCASVSELDVQHTFCTVQRRVTKISTIMNNRSSEQIRYDNFVNICLIFNSFSRSSGPGTL
jgi:hypothetical protein